MNRPIRIASALALASTLALVTSGCTRGASADEREDARALDAVLAADQALDDALREVDAKSRADGPTAADVIDSRAIPLADRVVERANGVAMRSAWGRERQGELATSARNRRAELPRYARALREDDLQAKLTAVEAQLELQQKAMEAASHASRAPQ
jgi:hypothetical protein